MAKMTPEEAVLRPVKFIEDIINEVKNKEHGYEPTVMSTTVPAYGNGKREYEEIDKENEVIEKACAKHRRARLQGSIHGRRKRRP